MSGVGYIKGRYAGIPYVDRGRTIDGCDCWGLVTLVYLVEANLVLPDHGEISSKDLRAIARTIDRERHGGGDTWLRVAERSRVQALDLCVMTMPGKSAPCHVGVYGGGGRILHTEIETDAAWCRLDHPSLAGRVLGFWRHRELALRAADRMVTP